MDAKTAMMPEVRHPTILASFLTAIAGYLDAVGFSEVNNIFVSFMSGNTTRFGTALVGGHLGVAFATCAVIVSFVIGAALGGFVADRSIGPLRIILLGELLLLAMAGLMFGSELGWSGLCPLAGAMGLQNASLQSVKGATVGKTFMTGTLVSFGQGLGRAISRGSIDGGTIAYGWSWLTFAASVVVGAVAWSQMGAGLSIATATVVVAILLVLSITRRL